MAKEKSKKTQIKEFSKLIKDNPHDFRGKTITGIASELEITRFDLEELCNYDDKFDKIIKLVIEFTKSMIIDLILQRKMNINNAVIEVLKDENLFERSESNIPLQLNITNDKNQLKLLQIEDDRMMQFSNQIIEEEENEE